MDVIYYHYFLFYKRLNTEVDNHFSASTAMGASQAFLLSWLYIIPLKFYCYDIEVLTIFAIAIAIIIFNCLYYMRGRGKKIIEKQPLYFNSKGFSVVCTLLFFLISLSYLFLGPIYSKYLLEQCSGK